MIAICAIDSKAIPFKPALYFNLANRMLLLDVYLFDNLAICERHLRAAAEARQPLRRIEPDRFPGTFNDRAIRTFSTKRRLDHAEILPGGGKLSLHMMVVDKQVSARMQGLEGLRNALRLLLRGRQLVKTIAAQDHQVEPSRPFLAQYICLDNNNSFLRFRRQLLDLLMKALQHPGGLIHPKDRVTIQRQREQDPSRPAKGLEDPQGTGITDQRTDQLHIVPFGFTLIVDLCHMKIRVVSIEVVVVHEYLSYLFQFNITNPARQTRIPRILIQEILSLNRRTATGTRISEATTLTSTAAIPRCQPAR